MHADQNHRKTDRSQTKFEFQGLGNRKVQVDFSGGHLSSNGGTLFLREVDERLALSARLSGCFRDLRDERYVEHSLPALIAQRVHGIALGHEDLNDHEALRVDPLFAPSCGRRDVLGEGRRSEPEVGKPLAGKSTLNRLELGAQDTKGHYRKIQADADKIQDLLLTMGVEAVPADSKVIVLDFDTTDDPIHGGQEARFYHGYYRKYCYLPLYCFCGNIPLWAELRPSTRTGAPAPRRLWRRSCRPSGCGSERRSS